MVEKHNERYFIYPKPEFLPLDQTCLQIVRKLKENNWKKKGIEVSFGRRCQEPLIEYTEGVQGKDFWLYFCRKQGKSKLPKNITDIAGVNRIVIPQQELLIYEGNDLIYFRYAGDDWERDQETFMHIPKIDSRYYNDENGNGSRLYLRYISSWKPEYLEVRNNGLSPFLIHDNRQGREYGLIPQDAPSYETQTVIADINRWLQENVVVKL